MSSDSKLILPLEVSNAIYHDCEYFSSKYASGSIDGRDKMIWSKYLAHYKKKSSHQSLHNQMPEAFVPLSPSARNPQKRELDEYVNDGKFITTFELINREKYGNQNAKSQRRNQSSSLLYSPFSDEKKVILQETQGQVVYPTLNDTTRYCSICGQDYSHLSGSVATVKGSNPMKQGNLKRQHKDLMASGIYNRIIKTSVKEKPKKEVSKELKSLVNEEIVKWSDSSNSLSLKKRDKLNQPLRNFLPSRGKHLPRPVIPIGPRFQAEVPKWEGTTNLKNHNSDDDLKWLGTQIWPMPVIGKIKTNGIGKGRLDSCSCDFSGSVDCVQLHIREARELLRLEIGAAFTSWKFHDMGEDVAKSWALDEQMEFESMVKLNMVSNETNFWKLAMERFPSKSMKCLVNYYYNVHVLRRMKMETGSSFSAICGDSD